MKKIFTMMLCVMLSLSGCGSMDDEIFVETVSESEYENIVDVEFEKLKELGTYKFEYHNGEQARAYAYETTKEKFDTYAEELYDRYPDSEFWYNDMIKVYSGDISVYADWYEDEARICVWIEVNGGVE